MASELDDKEGGRKKPLGQSAAVDKTDVPAQSGEVTEEVARVVNLLQRLDKLHSKSSSGAGGQTNAPPRPEYGGLSSLSGRRAERTAPRAVQPLPVSFLPPPLPPAADLPSVLKVPPGNVAGGVDPAVEAASQVSVTLGAGAAVAAAGRPRRDKAPVGLISAVVIGIVALGGWGLYQFQRSLPLARSAQVDAPPTVAAAQARLDAVASVSKAKPVEGAGAGCPATVVSIERGVMTLAINDPARTGQTVSIAVGDLPYKAAFDARGGLRFSAPLLDAISAVRWDRANGPACEQMVAMPPSAGLLRVALVWPGEAVLDLHVIEPNAWSGGPSGHISPVNPNADQARGAGILQAFGKGGGGANVQVYSVDVSKIAPGGILNAFVKPAAIAGDASNAACSDGVKPVAAAHVQYQVHILRPGSGSGEFSRESQSFSMPVEACPGRSADRSERIIIRN